YSRPSASGSGPRAAAFPRPGFGRDLGDALIDWETAGPVDPIVELEQVAWLNVKLHDEVVADIEALPMLADRAGQLRAPLDAYARAAEERATFLERMVAF